MGKHDKGKKHGKKQKRSAEEVTSLAPEVEAPAPDESRKEKKKRKKTEKAAKKEAVAQGKAKADGTSSARRDGAVRSATARKAPRRASAATDTAEAFREATAAVGAAALAAADAGEGAISVAAHERRQSTVGVHGASEVERQMARGRHRHVDLHEAYESIHYREFKILLKAEDFSADVARDVADYWRLARRVAGQLLLSVRRNRTEARPRLREIVFLDTPDFDLYRNAFMLRVRREVGPEGLAARCELTLKFRDSDIGRALGVDLKAAADYGGQVKFKEEILLVSSALGGMRSIFSHTCQLKNYEGPLPATFGDCLRIFPILGVLSIPPETRIAPAIETPVEEVLYDLGELGFRGAKTAKVDMAIWRNAATGQILIGEFAYETHFRHYGRLNPVPKLRSERLYRILQRETGAWVELGNTKTWLYYGLSGRKIHDE